LHQLLTESDLSYLDNNQDSLIFQSLKQEEVEFIEKENLSSTRSAWIHYD